MGFENRSDAGRRLAQALASYKDQRPVILALPRGGVPVAAEVAAAFHAPLDLVLVRKIGVPAQPELAMGAVVDGGAPIIVRNDDVIRLENIGEAEFQAVCDRELAEINRRRKCYLGNRARVDVAGRVTIVIDDGIATGATTRAALRATRQRQPKRLVLAVPVAPTEFWPQCAKRLTTSSAWRTTSSSARSVTTIPISARPRIRRSSMLSRASHPTQRNGQKSPRFETQQGRCRPFQADRVGGCET